MRSQGYRKESLIWNSQNLVICQPLAFKILLVLLITLLCFLASVFTGCLGGLTILHLSVGKKTPLEFLVMASVVVTLIVTAIRNNYINILLKTISVFFLSVLFIVLIKFFGEIQNISLPTFLARSWLVPTLGSGITIISFLAFRFSLAITEILVKKNKVFKIIYIFAIVLGAIAGTFIFVSIEIRSTDTSASIIGQYAAQDTRIRILTNSVAQGYGGEKASNSAYKQARGQYIAKLDADDIAHPQRLERQLNFLETNPDIFLVGSWLTLIDQHGKIIGKRHYPTEPDDILREFYYRNCIGHPSIMFRNNVITDDFYILRFAALNDYYSHFVHLQAGLKMANLPDYLVYYRVHDSNTTFSGLKRQWFTNLWIKQSFVDDFGYRPPLSHRLTMQLITMGIRILPERLLMRMMNQARKLFNT